MEPRLSSRRSELLLPAPAPFAVAQAGAVQKVVEGDVVPIEERYVDGQIVLRQRRAHVARPPAADRIGREFPVDLRHRKAGKLRHQVELVVGRDRELHDAYATNVPPACQSGIPFGPDFRRSRPIYGDRPCPHAPVLPSLALFCIIAPDRGEGGNRRGRCGVRRELGLFGAFAPRPPSPRPRPTRPCREIGFVFSHYLAGRVRHNHFLIKHLPSLAPLRKLGLFRTFPPGNADLRIGTMAGIWFVCTTPPRPQAPCDRPQAVSCGGSVLNPQSKNWVCFCAFPRRSPWTPPGGRRIGFVLHDCPRVPRPWSLVPLGSAGNWVRFAHFVPRWPIRPLGRQAVGGVPRRVCLQSAIRSPQSRHWLPSALKS